MEKMNPNLITPEDIYREAMRSLGQDISPRDHASDDLACAESLTMVLSNAGCIMPEFLSTALLNSYLAGSASVWEKVDVPKMGDIIISPTGKGGRGGVVHGHCGIVMDGESVASNSSRDGRFMINFTLTSWRQRFVNLGGYPMLFYRKKFTVPPPPITPEEVAVVEQAVEVAKEAAKVPSLRMQVLDFLRVLFSFLSTKK